jgi:peptidoglycan/LPS O-acetylase OafA/YrhL
MINTLTSLRLFFALLVLVSHLEIMNKCFAKHLFLEGYVGVSFFFILSGFIIAYNYTDKVSTRDNKKDYYIARIARIYPLHLLTLFIAFFISELPIDKLSTWIKLVTSATLTNAYIPRSDFFFALNAPAWSLCCEQLFYFAFPLIATITKSRRNIITILGIYTAIIIIGAQITPEEYAKGIWYVNPITRFPDFIIGIATYHIYNRIKGWNSGKWKATALEAGTLALFAIFYIYAEDVPRIYRYNIYYWLPIAAIIVTFALQKGFLSTILSQKVFIIGGEISFGIYLIHLFIVNAMGKHCQELDAITGTTIAVSTTVVASYISYKFIEKPANKAVKKLLKYKK